MTVARQPQLYSHVDSRSQKLVHLVWCGGMQEGNPVVYPESLCQVGADRLVKHIEKEIHKQMGSFLHPKLGLSKWCKEINQGAVLWMW